MTEPGSSALLDAEKDLQTAQQESDPHRQGQYARSAADAAAELVVGTETSGADRERAAWIMDAAVALSTRSMLGEAKAGLADARAQTDPQRRRELARAAVSKAQQVTRHRDLSEEDRAAARQVIGHGRMLTMTLGVSTSRQQRVEREQEQPGIAL